MDTVGQIFDIKKGKKVSSVQERLTSDSLRYIQIGDLRNDNKLQFTKDTHLVDVDQNDLVIAWDGANAGTIGYGLKGIIGSTLARLKIKKEFVSFYDANFLGFFLQSKFEYLRARTTGATIPHISKTALQDIEVPEIDISTQRQIVAVLDKAKDLIDKRQQSIDLLDELLRATFLDMFGDPISNTKGLEIRKLKDISTLERGRFSPRPRNDPSFFGGEYPFIQTGDISQSKYRLSKYSQTLNHKGARVSKELKKGDIVIAIVGATIGKTAILELDTYATDSIIAIRGEESILQNTFLEFVLRLYRPVLLDKAPEAARANINLKILGDLDIIVPSYSRQLDFRRASEAIYGQIVQLEGNKASIEYLFQSLLQRAFHGELAFSPVAELADEQPEVQSDISTETEHTPKEVEHLGEDEVAEGMARNLFGDKDRFVLEYELDQEKEDESENLVFKASNLVPKLKFNFDNALLVLKQEFNKVIFTFEELREAIGRELDGTIEYKDLQIFLFDLLDSGSLRQIELTPELSREKIDMEAIKVRSAIGFQLVETPPQ